MSWIKRTEACGREGAENPRKKLTNINKEPTAIEQ